MFSSRLCLPKGKYFNFKPFRDNFLAQLLYCVANGFNKYSSFLSNDKQQYCSIVKHEVKMSTASLETEQWTSLSTYPGHAYLHLHCLLEGREIAPGQNYLLYKHKYMSSNSQHPCKKPSMAKYAYNREK